MLLSYLNRLASDFARVVYLFFRRESFQQSVTDALTMIRGWRLLTLSLNIFLICLFIASSVSCAVDIHIGAMRMHLRDLKRLCVHF